MKKKNSIDFLDLSITRAHNKLTIDIYRKPTTTNTTINFMSNHPLEHKMAAYRYHIERMHKLPLDPIKKQKRVGDNTSNRWKQQCANKTTPKTISPNHEKRKPENRTEWEQKMDHIYVLQSQNKSCHEHIQKHQLTHSVQNNINTTTTYRAKATSPYTWPRQKWHI